MTVEPTDAEALATVETALTEVLANLATALTEQENITPMLAAAEGRVAALLIQERAGSSTFTMPASGRGYLPFNDETHAAPLPGSPADLLITARAAHAEVAAEAQGVSAVVVRLQLRRDRLRKAQRTLLERLGAGDEKPLRSEPGSQL